MRAIASTVVVYIVMSSTPVELPALKNITSIIIKEFPCAWYYSTTNFKIHLDSHITGFVMLLNLRPVIKLTPSYKTYRVRQNNTRVRGIYSRTPCNLGHLHTKSAEWNCLKFALQTLRDRICSLRL